MSHLLVKGADYTFTKLPESREWFRLINGTVNALHELDVDVSLIETIGPIGKLAKGIDGFYYGKKSLEDSYIVVLSAQKFSQARNKENFFELFDATVRFTGNTLAAFKWFGTLGGVVMLSPYAKSFGYVKNVCSVYSASIAVITNIGIIRAKYNSGDLDRTEKMLEGTALVVVSLCSIWLNGIGGLSSYVGIDTFIERGLDYPKPWTFASVIILSNVTGIAKNIAQA
ncbi:MAG: hypothetical protein KDK96_03105 [Chlamydiia bacterium]|nr:hypothetical protein [Chlamydiia bacterium]